VDKAYIKCVLRRSIPSIKFEEHDAKGDIHPDHIVHCVVPGKDVRLLEFAVDKLGKKAIWPMISSFNGHHRTIDLSAN